MEKRFEFKELSDELFEQVYNKLLTTTENKAWIPYGGIYNFGIYLNNILIGIMEFQPLFGENVSVDVALLKEYRNKSLATEFMELIPDEFGEYYSNYKYFLSLIDYNNKASIKSREKSSWIDVTSSYFDVFEKENCFYRVFVKENPYYQKEKVR